jgi:hypothetical protein
MAIHDGKVYVEQDKIRGRGGGEPALLPEEVQAFLAILHMM